LGSSSKMQISCSVINSTNTRIFEVQPFLGWRSQSWTWSLVFGELCPRSSWTLYLLVFIQLELVCFEFFLKNGRGTLIAKTPSLTMCSMQHLIWICLLSYLVDFYQGLGTSLMCKQINGMFMKEIHKLKKLFPWLELVRDLLVYCMSSWKLCYNKPRILQHLANSGKDNKDHCG